MMAHDLSDKIQQLIIVLLFLILGLAGCGDNDASAPVDRSPFKIVVVSDIHVRVPGNPDDGFYDSQTNLANSMLVVDRINETHMDADFVAVTGDLVGCLFSENPEDYLTQENNPALQFRKLFDHLNLPYYVALGNHDYHTGYDPVIREHIPAMDFEAVEIIWKSVLNVDPYYSFIHKGIHMIFLNSNRGMTRLLPCSGLETETLCMGSFDLDQLNWLDECLDRTEPAVIFCHHPPVELEPPSGQPFWVSMLSETMVIDPADPFYEIIERRKDNILAIFSGHWHLWREYTLFWVRNDSGTLDSVTYGQIGERIKNARAGLALAGIQEGGFVGIIANNRPEWAVLSYATYGLKARFVPMYEKELFSTWKYIITDSTIKVLIVSTREIYDKVKGLLKEIPTLEKIFIIDTDGENSLKALEDAGAKKPVEPVIPKPDDIAVLIYTSGTTGAPKGVLLSHGNLTYVSRGGYKIYPVLDQNQVCLSILPWAHSYALSGELNNWIQFGGSLGFMRDVTSLPEDLKLVRPTFLICVPRLFNKIYDGIMARMDEAGGIKKKLFIAARETAREKRELKEQGKSSPLTNVKFAILDKLVLSKIRAGFGGRLVGALTASAVMNREIGEFFYDIGVPAYDCYGLTETSPAVSMNCPDSYRLGSLGKVLDGQKVVIDKSIVEEGADDGEIIVYGPNVMKGYHNKPEATQKVMTADGGFITGDRGRFDADGFLYMTGRIKEQYKLENGKYVFPASIEEDIKLLPNVANAMVCGDGKPYNVCLLYPDFDVLGKYAEKNNIPSDPESLINNKAVTDMIEKEVVESLKLKYGGYEIPKKFIFLTEDFTLENAMITQTMKLKRRVAMKEYQGLIDAAYAKKRLRV